ncbi:hypothetical protein [Microtetraspora sp. NBRC 16547]|uniref:hypothetical protein n=1 Tax=Microtetraspora sp. NBRC 16547 TaxID=3030993 RepID=UPI0024A0F18D|nr:hypothetical protein [Microtetraspora sp. NBRC 16547]GLW96218.1 hypothetical protein Misp02_03050 [Microtetraspora sp. NBRC 16547]
MHPNKAVFVDHSGRRRKILTVMGIGASALTLTLFVTLVRGMVSETELPGIGWPGRQAGTPAGAASPERSPTATPSMASPGSTPPRRATPAASALPSPTPRVSFTRSARPTPRITYTGPAGSTPHEPSTDSAGPTSEPSSAPALDPEPTAGEVPNPGHGGTPPGQVGKTKEPK